MNFERTRKLRRTRFSAQRITRELKNEGFHCNDLDNAINTIRNSEVDSLKTEIRSSTAEDIINNAAYIYRLTR
jgi:hypothetical protein